MIVSASELTLKPGAVKATGKPAPSPIEQACEAIREAMAALPDATRAALTGMKPPQVVVQAEPRIREWVFHLHRNQDGQIHSIDAKGL